MILFFGCWTDKSGRSDTGHYFASPSGSEQYSMRRRTLERLEDDPKNYVPWGYKVDGGLAPRTPAGAQEPNGAAAFSQCGNRIGSLHEEWWSVISWWDNSVDDRPGSSCTFIVDRKATPEELLTEARAAFPQIFARFKYEIILPKL